MIRFGRIFKFSVCSPTGAECKPSPTALTSSGITLQHISLRNRVSQRTLMRPASNAASSAPTPSVSSTTPLDSSCDAPSSSKATTSGKPGAKNVDGLGSSLNEYARRALVSALCYGHSGILVDFPPDPGVTTLFEERQLGRRPYFNHIDAYQIWGWRQESPIPNSPLIKYASTNSPPSPRANSAKPAWSVCGSSTPKNTRSTSVTAKFTATLHL